MSSDGAILIIRAKPGISKPRKPKIVDIGEGKSAIELAVNAPAQDGKANKAILKALAQELEIPVCSLSILSGETSRLKRILIASPTPERQSRISQWLQSL